MCREYYLEPRFDVAFLRALKIPVRWTDGPPNRPPNTPFRPTERAPVLRAEDPEHPAAGLVASHLRWWMVPFFHRGRVDDWRVRCIHGRLETIDTRDAFRQPYVRRRALVPVTSYIEYDAPPGWAKGEPLRRWEVSWARRDSAQVRYFAGLWDISNPRDHDGPLESFAFVTGRPGRAYETPVADTGRPLNSRQPRVLTLEQGMDWLRLDGPGKALLLDPEPVGGFVVRPRPEHRDRA